MGTTGDGYTSIGALQSEGGPWDNDTVSLSYSHHRRTGLSLAQPNDSAWTHSYAYDRMHRLTNLTSSAGSFASDYYSGASTLLRKLHSPSGAFIPSSPTPTTAWGPAEKHADPRDPVTSRHNQLQSTL